MKIQNKIYRISILVLLAFLVLGHTGMIAQISINKDEADPDESAMLDIQSTEMGFLMPRMTSDQRMSIGNPANGLLLFDLDQNDFLYNAGTPAVPNWMPLMQTDGDTTIFCEKRIPISSIPFTIDEPGSYYLTTNLTNTVNNGDGITINTDNVTLDLNGFGLYGSTVVNSDDGIVILGDQDYIHIKNGYVVGWNGDGVNALNADYSIFENLVARRNGGDGIVTDFSCLIIHCSADSNDVDGLEVDDGGIIINCSASNNGDNGIQASEGSLVKNCTAFRNESDGIDVAAGGRVEGCNSFWNDIYGIDIALGGSVINCVANNNGRNGIDVASSCYVTKNVANNNGSCIAFGTCPTTGSTSGSGIRCFANSQIVGNYTAGNVVGIYMASTDAFVSGNTAYSNSHAGIVATASGSMFESNRTSGNGFAPDPDKSLTSNPGNYSININCAFGPIINVAGLGLINATTAPGSDHPLANFEY